MLQELHTLSFSYDKVQETQYKNIKKISAWRRARDTG
jgi:hypothetical protein